MRLSHIAPRLRKYGLTVVETAGWANRGYAGWDLSDIRGILWHHTATNRAAFRYNTAPTLGLCINGRSDLPGPLCQIVFGRDGVVYLTAAGWANHAGAGIAHGVPRDRGNAHLVGIEMESSGVAPWDWTADQKRVAPYLGAALELELLMHRAPQDRIQIGHLEYSSQGKIDPAGWPGGMNGLRDQINAKIAELQGGTKAGSAGSTYKPKPVSDTVDKTGPHWVVQPGDTLNKIATYYGIPGSAARIAKYNRIGDPNRIKPGQKIYIPGPLAWVVDPGDTWGKIDAYYGYAPGAVKSRNPGVRDLKVGQVLKVWG